MSSKLIESARRGLAALQKAGAIGKVTMRQFDVICPPPVRAFRTIHVGTRVSSGIASGILRTELDESLTVDVWSPKSLRAS